MQESSAGHTDQAGLWVVEGKKQGGLVESPGREEETSLEEGRTACRNRVGEVHQSWGSREGLLVGQSERSAEDLEDSRMEGTEGLEGHAIAVGWKAVGNLAVAAAVAAAAAVAVVAEEVRPERLGAAVQPMRRTR